MRLLLDTQIYLWFLADSRRLSKKARERIEETDEVFVSAVSIWEAAVKIGIGRLEVDPKNLVAGIAGSGFNELPVYAKHGALVATLPDYHRDPFDRLLIAQALHEPMRLLSADETLKRYSDLVEIV